MNDRDAWFGVELRHLAALSAISREGSFRGAADSLGYVQSAVSQRIVQLERLVGVRLVDRTRGSKKIRVTPMGELLVEHADEILARLQAARADLASHSETDREETLRIGVVPAVAAGLLPSILRSLAAKAPDLRIDVAESASDADLFERIEQGEVDVAFAELPLPSGPFRSRNILRDPCVLLVSAGSEWTDRTEPPTVEELAQAPLVVLEGARSTCALEMWFTAQGLEPNVALRATNEATLRAFVAAGLGVAILPRLAVEPWDARTVSIDLEGMVPGRRIAICWHEARVGGGALEAFREVTTRVAGDVGTRRGAAAREDLRAIGLAAA
jgi:DNA-binding transcriptional LysR family regulator